MDADALIALLSAVIEADYRTIIFGVGILYFSYQLKLQRLLNEAIIELKKNIDAQLMEYVEEVLSGVEEHSSSVANAIIDDAPLPKGHKVNDEVYYREAQKTIFALLLNRTLFQGTKDRIKIKIEENGFYDVDSDTLERYIQENSKLLLHANRKEMRGVISSGVPLLHNTADRRFTEQNAVDAFRRIILKAKELKIKERTKRDKLTQEYDLLSKFKPFKK